MEVDHSVDLGLFIIEGNDPVGNIGTVIGTVTGFHFVGVFPVLELDHTRHNSDELLAFVLRHFYLARRLGQDFDEERFHVPVYLALCEVMKSQ